MWERRRDWRRIVGQNKTTYTQNLWEDSNEKIIRVALGEIARRQVGRLGQDCCSGYQQEGGANYQ